MRLTWINACALVGELKIYFETIEAEKRAQLLMFFNPQEIHDR